METITAELNVTVKDGPKIAMPPVVLEVEAYDKFKIALGSGETKKVDVQPGDKGVSFLLITSSLYTPKDAAKKKKLTFAVKPEDEQPPISLSEPQLYVGADAIAALLGNIKEITFKNDLMDPTDENVKPSDKKDPEQEEQKKKGKDETTEDADKSKPPVVEISILVGRNASSPVMAEKSKSDN